MCCLGSRSARCTRCLVLATHRDQLTRRCGRSFALTAKPRSSCPAPQGSDSSHLKAGASSEVPGEQGRGVRGAAAAAVLDRLPDPRQRERGRGRGPGDLAALRGLADRARRRPRRSCRPWSPGSRSTCCARRGSGGRSTSGRGSPSRCSPIRTRIRPGRRSWPTRCRWRRCCCWSGSARSSGRCSCCGRCSGSASPRSPRRWDGRRRRAASSRCGRGATWTRAGRGSRRTAGSARSSAARFFDALREGDVDGLRELLAADVQLVGDGGGKAPQLATGRHRRRRTWPACSPPICPLLVRIDVTSGAARGERPAGRDLPRPGRQGAQHAWRSTCSAGGSRRSAR